MRKPLHFTIPLHSQDKTMLLLILLISLFCSATVRAANPVFLSFPAALTQSGCTSDGTWSAWYNSMAPSAASRFDSDLHAVIQRKTGDVLCAVPRGIQLQAVEPYPANTAFSVNWHMKDGVAYGFTSKTPDVDFQVRFCCPWVEATVATGTSAPRTTAPVATVQPTTASAFRATAQRTGAPTAEVTGQPTGTSAPKF